MSPSRLPASRIANAVCQRAPLPLRMCEGAEEPAAEAPVAEESAAPPPRSKGKKTPLEELEVGSTIEGTIRSVQSYGAFVDLGASTDGLLHVSEMSDEFVKDANDMFKVGDSVSVRIKSINTEKGQVALSCKSESAEPRRSSPRRGKVDLSEYESADEKEFITGTVNSITSYGAFVTLKEGVDGLVHISAIQEGGVSKVEDVLSEGQQVQVRVVSFDGSKRRIGLSMKPWVEGGDEAASGGRRQRRSRDDDDMDDAAFQMSEDELAELAITVEPVGIEVMSPFEAAMARSEEKKAAKAAGKRYADVVL